VNLRQRDERVMAAASRDGQEVDITGFGPEQLAALHKQLTNELEVLQTSYGNLKMAQSRFATSAEALIEFKPENEGKEILVPLTASLYVRGAMVDVGKVMVDVGTGYYVEKSIADARRFLLGRVELVRDQVEKIGATLVNKRTDVDTVVAVLQERMQRSPTPTTAQQAPPTRPSAKSQ